MVTHRFYVGVLPKKGQGFIMKKFIQTIFAFMALAFTFSILTPTAIAANIQVETPVIIENGLARSYMETLPIQYEIWDDKTISDSGKSAKTYKNYVYKDFHFVHGYTSTETMERLEMKPIDTEFYEKAYLVTITYEFY